MFFKKSYNYFNQTIIEKIYNLNIQFDYYEIKPIYYKEGECIKVRGFNPESPCSTYDIFIPVDEEIETINEETIKLQLKKYTPNVKIRSALLQK